MRETRHHRLTVPILMTRLDKVPVHLHEIRPHVQDHLEVGLPEPDVVEGDAHTRVAKSVERGR